MMNNATQRSPTNRKCGTHVCIGLFVLLMPVLLGCASEKLVLAGNPQLSDGTTQTRLRHEASDGGSFPVSQASYQESSPRVYTTPNSMVLGQGMVPHNMMENSPTLAPPMSNPTAAPVTYSFFDASQTMPTEALLPNQATNPPQFEEQLPYSLPQEQVIASAFESYETPVAARPVSTDHQMSRRNVNVIGSEFRSPRTTATELMIAFKDKNAVLEASIEELKNENRELVEKVKAEIEARGRVEKELAESRGINRELKDLVAKLRVKLKTVEEEKIALKVEAETALKQIESNLDAVLMNTLSGVRKENSLRQSGK